MIHVQHLGLHAGSFRVWDVNLHVGSDEYFVLLGPTGSGKTLLISCICGLIGADSGTISIDGRDVTYEDPRRRRVGYVPQDGALFPHMSVAENVTFALRARRHGFRRALREVSDLVETLGIGYLMGRSPVHLSGGERQKVALARALAARPKVLLLDEPVSALDEPTRRGICSELRRVQRELQVATIHICHNREEALQVADVAGIMYGGRLVQTGQMQELLHRPVSEDVARLLGAENIFTGEAVPEGEGMAAINFGWGSLRVPVSSSLEGLRIGGKEMRFMVRPESLTLCPEDRENAVTGVLEAAHYMGAYTRLEFDNGVVVFTRPAEHTQDLVPGRRYGVHFPPDAVHVLPAQPSSDA